MTIECHPIQPGEAGRQEWLTWRKPDITASVAGALLTEHPYTTAMHLWAEQSGTEFPPIAENKRMRRGRKLEKLVGEEVEELRPGWKIEPVNAYYRDADLRLGGTPDFWVLGDPRGRGVCQAKTADSDIIAKRWDGGTSAPEWIQWQLITEMLLTDSAFGCIACLDPYNWDCHIIDVERDGQAELALVRAVKMFWDQVASGIEPTPDFSRDAEVIKALTRTARPGAIVDLAGHNQVPELLESRATLHEMIATYKARCEAIDAELKYLMGDAELAAGIRGWRITYKTIDRVAYTVPAKTFRMLKITDRRHKEQP